MEPDPHEAMSNVSLRDRPRRSGIVPVLAAGLMIVGAVTLGLIGVMVFRASGTNADSARALAAAASLKPVVVAPPASVAEPVIAGRAVPPVEEKPAIVPEKPQPVAVATVPAPAPQVAAIAPAPVEAAPPAPASVVAPPAAIVVRPGATLPAAEIRSHVARAIAIFGEGDVSGARALLDRAARSGDGAALFALAETYDPVVLANRKVHGVKADAARARGLYSQALAAGMGEAKARIAALPQ